MNTSPHRLLGSLLIVVGAFALAAPARAADAVVDYPLPTTDTTGITAQTAPGVAGCLSGCASLRIPRGAAVPAKRQAMLAFAAPTGTTIVNAAIRLRYRTKQPTVSAHLQSRIAGRWLDAQRLRSPVGASATVNTGRGATAVAVTLTADGAVPARAVKADAENAVTVEAVQLTVRDLTAPTIAWDGAEPGASGWVRGTLCGAFTAQDVGLGVDHVDLAVGAAVGTVAAGPGTRLQPRPPVLSGTVCVDSAQVGDGTFGTTLSATDTGAGGNRSLGVDGRVRIDNTAPQVAYQAPADTEARLPVAQLTAADPASGVERVTATIDGFPAVVRTIGALTSVTPAMPLADGPHRLAWEVADVAGNVSTGTETLGVLDVTPPTIDDVQPQGLANPFSAVSAHGADTGAGLAVDGWRLAIDGVDVTGAADLSTPGSITYAPPRPWGEGEHVARVTAVDRSGNRTVRSWTFALPVLPAAPIAAPSPTVQPDGPALDAGGTPAEGAEAPPHRSAAVTLRSSARRPRVGSRIVLRGSVEGITARTVRLEARVGRTWRLVARVAVSTAGTYATPVRLPQPGRYDVRARVGTTASPVVHVTAR